MPSPKLEQARAQAIALTSTGCSLFQAMAANQWQFQLAGNFEFQFDHLLPIPQRPIRVEHRQAQINTYLQTQFELSQPGGGPDPYAQFDFSGVAQSSELCGILSSPLQSFREGAAFVSNLMLSCLFGLFYYVLKLPFNAICAFIVSLDWWLVFALFFAVMLSPMTSTVRFGNENRTMRLVVDLEYELVEDFRRWGIIKITALVFWSGLLTYLAVYSCSRASP